MMKEAMRKYIQPMHTCGTPGEYATMEFRMDDGGDGEYLVLNVYEFAFDSEAEIDALAAAMRALLATRAESDQPRAAALSAE